VRSIPNYIKRSMVTMFRIFIVYQPLKFFLTVSVFPLAAGLIIALRFAWFFTQGNGSGHVQSLILSAVLLIVGFLTFLLAILGDLLSVNRRLLEELQQNQRRARLLGPGRAITDQKSRTVLEQLENLTEVRADHAE
jgi:hypothetical protein